MIYKIDIAVDPFMFGSEWPKCAIAIDMFANEHGMTIENHGLESFTTIFTNDSLKLFHFTLSKDCSGFIIDSLNRKLFYGLGYDMAIRMSEKRIEALQGKVMPRTIWPMRLLKTTPISEEVTN